MVDMMEPKMAFQLVLYLVESMEKHWVLYLVRWMADLSGATKEVLLDLCSAGQMDSNLVSLKVQLWAAYWVSKMGIPLAVWKVPQLACSKETNLAAKMARH